MTRVDTCSPGAEFIHEFSNFDGLFNSHDKRPIDKVQALVTYLQSYYFTQLIASGFHVLYTLPVWKAGATLTANALTEALHRSAEDGTLAAAAGEDLRAAVLGRRRFSGEKKRFVGVRVRDIGEFSDSRRKKVSEKSLKI